MTKLAMQAIDAELAAIESKPGSRQAELDAIESKPDSRDSRRQAELAAIEMWCLHAIGVVDYYCKMCKKALFAHWLTGAT